MGAINIIINDFDQIIYLIKLDLNQTTDTNASSKGLYCESSEKKHCGNGGFFPFGYYGMVEGAAKCFFAYIGNKSKMK